MHKDENFISYIVYKGFETLFICLEPRFEFKYTGQNDTSIFCTYKNTL